MKFTIALADEELGEQFWEAAEEALGHGADLTDEQVEAKVRELQDFAAQWLEDGACFTVLFDTEAGTATLQEVEA